MGYDGISQVDDEYEDGLPIEHLKRVSADNGKSAAAALSLPTGEWKEEMDMKGNLSYNKSCQADRGIAGQDTTDPIQSQVGLKKVIQGKKAERFCISRAG